MMLGRYATLKGCAACTSTLVSALDRGTAPKMANLAANAKMRVY